MNVEPASVDSLPAYKASGQLEYWGRTYRVESLLIKRGKEFGMVNVLFLDERTRRRLAERVLDSMTLSENAPTTGPLGLAESKKKIEAMMAKVGDANKTAETARESTITRTTNQKTDRKTRTGPEKKSEKTKPVPTTPKQHTKRESSTKKPALKTVVKKNTLKKHTAYDPFKLAINGDLETIKQYRDTGGDLNKTNSHGATPLHYAAFHGHLQMVIFLVVNGANVAGKDRQEATPLHMAAYNDHQQVALFLLKNRANAKQKNGDGYTPVELARLRGHKDLARKMEKSP